MLARAWQKRTVRPLTSERSTMASRPKRIKGGWHLKQTMLGPELNFRPHIPRTLRRGPAVSEVVSDYQMVGRYLQVVTVAGNVYLISGNPSSGTLTGALSILNSLLKDRQARNASGRERTDRTRGAPKQPGKR